VAVNVEVYDKDVGKDDFLGRFVTFVCNFSFSSVQLLIYDKTNFNMPYNPAVRLQNCYQKRSAM